MKVTNFKNCYCHTCEKPFHYLGIANHRAAHRSRKEDCMIGYTNGDVYNHRYSTPKKARSHEKGGER